MLESKTTLPLPVLLAGGRGTRLRPRTDVLPKALIPLRGRPLLWYVLRAIEQSGLPKPIVVVEYKADLIKAFFQDSDIEFFAAGGKDLVENFLRAVDTFNAPSYFAMSADILTSPRHFQAVVQSHIPHNGPDCAILSELPFTREKRWKYKLDNIGKLIAIEKSRHVGQIERLAILASRESLLKAGSLIGRPVVRTHLPKELKPFNGEWVLLLNAMLQARIDLHAELVDCPILNVNTKADLRRAEEFLDYFVKE